MSRDYVAEFLEKRNAAAAAQPSPLGRPQSSPRTPRPEPTGDAVEDHIALQRWRAANAPNPLKRQGEP
jgi:hypothetical protein